MDSKEFKSIKTKNKRKKNYIIVLNFPKVVHIDATSWTDQNLTKLNFAFRVVMSSIKWVWP